MDSIFMKNPTSNSTNVLFSKLIKIKLKIYLVHILTYLT